MTAIESSTPINLPQSPPRLFDIWFIRILAAAAITLFSIQFSYQHRRLMLHPMADDSNYFSDALGRLNIYYENGSLGLWQSLTHNPPHAPISTLLAAIGFSLFGRNEWAPYAANGLVILGLLAAVDWAAGSLKIWQRLMLYAFVAGTQLPLIAVTEFKPDLSWGILVAFSILFILRRPLIGSSTGRRIAVGALLGLCLLVKPSTFPLTIVLFGLTIALSFVCDVLDTGRARFPVILQTYGTALAAAIVVAGPYFLSAWRETYNYFYDNMIGSRKGLWETQGDRLTQLRYYLDGFAAEYTLGKFHFYILLGIAAITLGYLMTDHARRWRALAVVLVAVVAYTLPTTSVVKNPYFGAPFQLLLLFASIYGLSRLLVVARRRTLDQQKLALPSLPWHWLSPVWPLILFVAACAASLMLLTPPINGSRNEPYVIASTRLGEQVYQMIKRRSTSATVFVPAPATTVCATTLTCMSMLDGTEMHFTDMEPSLWDDKTLIKHWLDSADFVVTGDPGNTEAMTYIPTGTTGLPLYLEQTRARHDFVEFATLPTLPAGKVYHLFVQRPDPFSGIAGVQGVGSSMGPFPKLYIPLVLPAQWPQTRIDFNQPKPGKQILEMNGYTHQTGLVIDIFLDGKQIGLDSPPSFVGNDFSYFSYILHLSAGPHAIELRYSYHNSKPRQPVPILFKRLDLMPLE